MFNIKSVLGLDDRKITVVDRKTKQTFTETIYGEQSMKVIYGNQVGTKVASTLLTNKFISNLFGAYNESTLSKHKIEPFVKLLKIDAEEAEKDISEYSSFNDFFARKLKSTARTINQNNSAIICPGDGRLLVFPKIDDSTISHVKWAPIKLIDLFNHDNVLQEKYAGGACAILRLCPSDYHRVHFPTAGKAGITKVIPGVLHSVNPFALEQKIPVYCLNKRTICELESENFGNILLMEVGAMFVGTIVQTYRPASMVNKGDEKGFFKFGGSTSILFFEKNKIKFDADLVENSANATETYVKMGECIATNE